MADGTLRTLLVDDEPLAIERLQILCAGLDVSLVGSAGDAAAALRLIDALEPDLVLLDIAMPGLSGMELADRLRRRPRPPLIVFVTAFDAFAVAAFDAEAVDYLLKPIDRPRLARAIARAQARHAEPAVRRDDGRWASEFWVPHRGEIVRVDAADIQRVEAERDYMRLHVGERSYLMHATIAELERRLDPRRFVRLHRSTIVRRDMITGLRRDTGGGWSATLADGGTAAIGRTYLDAARAMARA